MHLPKEGIRNSKDPSTHAQAPGSPSTSFPKESNESSESWPASGIDGGEELGALSTSTTGPFSGSVGSIEEAISWSFMARVAVSKLVVFPGDSCPDTPTQEPHHRHIYTTSDPTSSTPRIHTFTSSKLQLWVSTNSFGSCFESSSKNLSLQGQDLVIYFWTHMSPLPHREAVLRAWKICQRRDRSGPESIVHFGGSDRETCRWIKPLGAGRFITGARGGGLSR